MKAGYNRQTFCFLVLLRRCALLSVVLAAFVLAAIIDSHAETVTAHDLMVGTPYQTRYYVKTGEETGPTVVVIGGVHGDEPAGYLAARRLVNWKITRGTLWLLPDAHKEAIRRNVRGYPGNMNNMFPGKANGDSMEQLAFQIFEMIRQAHPDLLLTLHESRELHVDNPTRFGQTFCYDFPALNPMMDRVLARANESLPPGREQFQRFVDPYPHCPTYQAYVQLHTPSTSIETCRQFPLERRVQQQLLVLEAFFDDQNLGYQQDDVPPLQGSRTLGRSTVVDRPSSPALGRTPVSNDGVPSLSGVGAPQSSASGGLPLSGSVPRASGSADPSIAATSHSGSSKKAHPAAVVAPGYHGKAVANVNESGVSSENSSSSNGNGVSRAGALVFLAGASIFAFTIWRLAFSKSRRLR